jgi:hypothetical protein
MLPQFWLNSQSGGSLISSNYQSQVFGNSPVTKLGQIWWNFQSYIGGIIANLLVPIFGPEISLAFGKVGLGIVLPSLNILVLLLVILGIIISLHRLKASELYVGFFFIGTLTAWTTHVSSAQARYLIPIVPFLYFYLLQAVMWLACRIPNPNTRKVPVIVLGLTSFIILFSVARDIQDWQNPICNRMTDLSIGTTWIRENTPQQSIVMVRDPVPDYLYARRKTVAYPTNGQDIEKTIASDGVNYVMVAPLLQLPRTYELDDLTKSYVLPLLTSNQEKFRLVHSDIANNVSVYEVGSH